MRIDALDTTVVPTRLHEFPSMKDGQTVKLTVGQAIDLLLDSPEFTGVPAAPTAVPGTNTTQLATTAFVKAALDLLVDTAPGTLDTLNELATALGDDPNFASTVTTALGNRLRIDLDGAYTNAQKGRGLSNLRSRRVSGLYDRIINGQGQISKRTYTTVADDIYWCDRHYILTQTAAITPSVTTVMNNGHWQMMRLTQSQASAQRMGNAQIIESKHCRDLRGREATLLASFKASSAINVRFAICEWVGTVDAPTSDIVNSWTNTNYTAGNFFIGGGNLNVLATDTFVAPTGGVPSLVSLKGTVGASANNLIVFYWTEATAAQNVTLDVAWSLVEGDATTEVDLPTPRGMSEENSLCERYYNIVRFSIAGWGAAGSSVYQTVAFPTMRAQPTVGVAAVGTSSNVTSSILTDATPNTVKLGCVVNAANMFAMDGQFISLDSEL